MEGNSIVGLKELSQKIGVPHHYLGKILQELARKGVLNSTKGPSGGYYSNPKTRKLYVLDILRITDGDAILTSCVLGMKNCNSQKPCPLHEYFVETRNHLQVLFAQKKLGTLAEEFLQKGKPERIDPPALVQI